MNIIVVLVLFFNLFELEVNGDLNLPEPQEIPIVSETKNTCPCSQAKVNLCRGGIYVDYYYNPPYSGYPKDATYLPPVDSIPNIVTNLTFIRDVVKDFIKQVNSQDTDDKKAIYVKDNYSYVQYLLQAVDKAAKKANNTEIITNL